MIVINGYKKYSNHVKYPANPNVKAMSLGARIGQAKFQRGRPKPGAAYNLFAKVYPMWVIGETRHTITGLVFFKRLKDGTILDMVGGGIFAAPERKP